MKGLVIRITHMKYDSFIFNYLKVMAKVKVFFCSCTHADTDADTEARAMTLAPRTFVPSRKKSTRTVRMGHIPPKLQHQQSRLKNWST